MSNKRRGNYSPNMSMPGSGVQRSGRGAFGILLCLLLPPVGLMFLWRKGVFRTRGRILVTALATVEMAVVISLMMPAASVTPTLPMPGSAERFQPAPESEALTALSNMDQLLRQQQGDEPQQDLTGVIDQQQDLARQQELLNTIVYVYNGGGSRYYHSVTVCGNQSNLLTLTLEEALAQQLGACPDCDAPSFSQLGN